MIKNLPLIPPPNLRKNNSMSALSKSQIPLRKNIHRPIQKRIQPVYPKLSLKKSSLSGSDFSSSNLLQSSDLELKTTAKNKLTKRASIKRKPKDDLSTYKLFNQKLFNVPKKYNFDAFIFKEKQKIDLEHIKEKEAFTHYIIKKYLSKKNFTPKKSKNRVLFVILDGTIIMNDESITGYFVEIPGEAILKKLMREERKKIMQTVCDKCTELFHFKHPLNYIFNHEEKFIIDLLELTPEENYILISHKVNCIGIKLIPSPSFVQIYDSDQFREELKLINEKEQSPYDSGKTTTRIKEFKFDKSRKRNTKYDKLKFKKLKLSQSFSEGMFEEDEFQYYSEDEERKKELVLDDILVSSLIRNEYLMKHIADKANEYIENELGRVKQKEEKTDLYNDFLKFQIDYDKVLSKYSNQLGCKDVSNLTEHKFKPQITPNEVIESIKITNFLTGIEKEQKIFIQRKETYPYVKKNAKQNDVYYRLDTTIGREFPNFFLFNIPKLESKFRGFNRNALYDLYATYKTMLTFSYTLNKSKIILQNGIDFKTFWYCLKEFQNEKEGFADNLFHQFNKSKTGLLTFIEFLEGMSYLKSGNLDEKFALFIDALDKSGKGELGYDEICDVCYGALERNMTKNKIEELPKGDKAVLLNMAKFFADYIYKIMKKQFNQSLPIQDIKESVMNDMENRDYFTLMVGM